MSMILAFTLTMPVCNSWDGHWSGEDRLHVRVRNLGRSQKAVAAGRALVGSHYYRWSDGWVACVTVREVDAAEARVLRRRSAGFCGYDWMIDSLLSYGEIRSRVRR